MRQGHSCVSVCMVPWLGLCLTVLQRCLHDNISSHSVGRRAVCGVFCQRRHGGRQCARLLSGVHGAFALAAAAVTRQLQPRFQEQSSGASACCISRHVSRRCRTVTVLAPFSRKPVLLQPLHRCTSGPPAGRSVQVSAELSPAGIAG
jgi:hypothetical protein